MLTVRMDDPHGYGRIIRDSAGRFVRCVEQKDASAEELAVREVAVSIYCFSTPALLDGARWPDQRQRTRRILPD